MNRWIIGMVLGCLTACGGSPEATEAPAAEVAVSFENRASSLDGEAVVGFRRDWSVVQNGNLVVGSQARIVYDAERLPDCRQEQGGAPLWAITGHWRLAGEEGTFEAGGHSPSNNTTPAVIPLRKTGELEVWFEVTSRSGCHAWDSAYGRNYRFAVQEPGPTLDFLPNWIEQQSGSTVGARNVVVQYDLSRLPKCRQGYNGLPTWDILAWYRFDGGSAAYFPATRTQGYTRLMNPVVISIPETARRLELWFNANDRGGCTEWDSRFGENYRFDL